ncbi:MULTISPECIES: DUF1796 family putative cysteine peptidase [Methylobacterium]|uniref:DUF1796 family putative cysteine peptidase n=1 Tax=Methylobacterium TaxID=407 RepID=UPI0013E9D527|nr:DUF1796 family putative cysteine peptidase [Methylobacterium sp. DB0501]NGM38128.1 hypothetical protein [Methylobacterium sp. DB0501]
MLDKEYDWIISLGSNCTPAWNIRKQLKQPEAFPFDWWISDYYPTLSVLRSNFSNMFDNDEMLIVDNCSTVVSKRYWLKYHHDFPHKPGTGQVSEDFKSHLNAVRGKYDRRVQRLHDAMRSGSILFVRQGGVNSTQSYPDEEKLKNSHALYDMLVRLWPHAEFDLLVIEDNNLGNPVISMSNGRIAFDQFPPSSSKGHDWREAEYAALWERQRISRIIPLQP